MDGKALHLLDMFVQATTALPRRIHLKELNAFIIHVHQCKSSITTAEVTEYLITREFTREEARRLSLVFFQGSELLAQYDKAEMSP
jgi:hypothetical protein